MEAVVRADFESDRLLTRDFVLICLGRGAFFGSVGMIIPLIPLYVLHVGGSEAIIGVVISVFTLAIVVTNPFIGRASDEGGQKRLMLLGSAVFAIAPLLYPFTLNVALLLIVRLFHGTGLSNYNISSSAYVADSTPPRRRGEAMGWFGLAQNVAQGITPALAMVIYHTAGFNAVFVAASALAAFAMLLTALLAEPRRESARPHGSRGQLFNRDALFPAAIVWCVGVTYGAIIAFLPLYAIKNGVDNPGLYFTAWSLSLLFSRPIAGKLSDRFGRGVVIVPGLLFAAAAMWVLPWATSLSLILVSAVIYGLGFGIAHPTLMALAIDQAGMKNRGASMATFNGAFDLGIGLGAIVMGLVLQFLSFGTMFVVAGAMPLLGIAAFGWRAATRNHPKKPAAEPAA